MRTTAIISGLFVALPAIAGADVERERASPPVATAEVTGGWGLQLGDTEYLPDGAAGQYKFPFFSGFQGGASAGWLFMPDLALIGTYEYWTSSSIEGSVTGAIDRVQGAVRYQTATVGLRLYRDLGPGRLRGDMSAGLIFPFETTVEYDWGAALAPAGISGTGTRTDRYKLGYGLQAALGYEVPIYRQAFIAAALELRAFQSNNKGEDMSLDNMVMDFSAPTPIDVTMETTQPTTYSVQDLGLRVGVGTRF